MGWACGEVVAGGRGEGNYVHEYMYVRMYNRDAHDCFTELIIILPKVRLAPPIAQ